MMRRQPLRRFAPLRRRTPLRQRKATPLARRGPSTKRWEAHREQSREIIKGRSHERCEAPSCPNLGTEGAHLFGRGRKIAEPFASHPLLMRWLCLEHHRAIDQGRDPQLRHRLESKAADDFRSLYAPFWRPLRGSTPLETMRQLVDALVADGWKYDASSNSISQGQAA